LPALPGGTHSVATAISRDGRVIVGYGDAPGHDWADIIWTEGAAHFLEPAPPQYGIYPKAVNTDGSIIVGGFGYFTRWDALTGGVDLGAQWFPDGLNGPESALATNARGTLIGGCVGVPLRPGSADWGLIWTPR